MSDEKQNNNLVIGHVSFGPFNPEAKTIDVPSIMRAAGYNEGYKAGVEAALHTLASMTILGPASPADVVARISEAIRTLTKEK